MYGFRSKLACLSKSVKVTDSNINASLLSNLPFSAQYKSLVFYSTGRWCQCSKQFTAVAYDCSKISYFGSLGTAWNHAHKAARSVL
jgi:hypothetical protein